MGEGKKKRHKRKYKRKNGDVKGKGVSELLIHWNFLRMNMRECVERVIEKKGQGKVSHRFSEKKRVWLESHTKKSGTSGCAKKS